MIHTRARACARTHTHTHTKHTEGDMVQGKKITEIKVTGKKATEKSDWKKVTEMTD